jgi:hypothetical protein
MGIDWVHTALFDGAYWISILLSDSSSKNPLVRQLGRYLLWPRVCPDARGANRERRGTTDQSRAPLAGVQVD